MRIIILKANHKHTLQLHCLNLKHFACIPITVLCKVKRVQLRIILRSFRKELQKLNNYLVPASTK